jgi:hypothetical protein
LDCIASVAFAIWACTAVLSRASTARKDGQWRSYNGDAGSTKYAPLVQVNKNNVASFESRGGVRPLIPRSRPEIPSCEFHRIFVRRR